MRKLALGLAMVAAFLLVACGPAEPDDSQPEIPPAEAGPTATLPALAEGSGAIVGRVLVPDQTIPPNTMVFLASFFRHETEEWGFFMLQPNKAVTAAVSSDGFFQAQGVEPGEYVIVVGPTAEESVAILGDDGDPLVFAVAAGQIVDAGEQFVFLESGPVLQPVPVTPAAGYPPPPTRSSSYP